MSVPAAASCGGERPLDGRMSGRTLTPTLTPTGTPDPREDPREGSEDRGISLGVNTGTPIRGSAACQGTWRRSGWGMAVVVGGPFVRGYAMRDMPALV